MKDVALRMLAKVLPGWRAMPECEGDDEENILVDNTGVVWYFDLNLVATLEDMLTPEEWREYLANIAPEDVHFIPKNQGMAWIITDWMQAIRHASAQTCCNAIYPIFQARKARGG